MALAELVLLVADASAPGRGLRHGTRVVARPLATPRCDGEQAVAAVK